MYGVLRLNTVFCRPMSSLYNIYIYNNIYMYAYTYIYKVSSMIIGVCAYTNSWVACLTCLVGVGI